MSVRHLAISLGALLCLASLAATPGCDDGPAPADADADIDADVDTDVDTDVDADADADQPPWPDVPDPPDTTATLQSKTRGFRLYYRERVERALTAYNRYALFGDSGFGSNIGAVAVARTGDEIEVVPMPCDNNLIGTGAWTAYNAYRVFRSRPLELTLIRMFDGLAYFESVSGHPGLTSREVLPGWTRVMDGVAGAVTRTRGGVPVTSPTPPDPALEAEVLATFYGGLRITYREDPDDTFFNFLPLGRLEDYAVTHSFDELPRFLRVSDCCSSFMRTPEGYPWAGAYWGNHNSRDNFPDIALGLIAARWAASDEGAGEEVRAAAQRALEAGRRIGDLIMDSGSALMTVADQDPYETLTVSGVIRPNGNPGSQDLGSLNACPMVYLARALSSDGLSAPAPTLPLGPDQAMLETLSVLVDCEIPDGGPVCTSVGDAWCGRQWWNFDQLEVGGEPLLDYLERHPEIAPSILASFQNDYDDVVEAMMALVHYARGVGDEVLYGQARATLYFLTVLQAALAELAFPDRPDELANARYSAALYQAQAELPTTPGDLRGLDPAEEEIEALEALLQIEETPDPPLQTDEELLARVEGRLAGADEAQVARYRAEYGASPPVRRAGEGYEARGAPLEARPWHPVERARHRHIGGLRLLQAITLCERAPQLLDCSWAAIGCARPDLDASGVVDAADRAAFDAARATHAGATCSDANGWCGGADLDRDGTAGVEDSAYMDAAQGCVHP